MKSRNPIIKRIGLSLSLFILAVFSVSAADVLWTGASGDHYWHTAANWQGNQVPGKDDRAVFRGAVSNIDCYLFQQVIVGGLLIEADFQGELYQAGGDCHDLSNPNEQAAIYIGPQNLEIQAGTFHGGNGEIIYFGDLLISGGYIQSCQSDMINANTLGLHWNEFNLGLEILEDPCNQISEQLHYNWSDIGFGCAFAHLITPAIYGDYQRVSLRERWIEITFSTGDLHDLYHDETFDWGKPLSLNLRAVNENDEVLKTYKLDFELNKDKALQQILINYAGLGEEVSAFYVAGRDYESGAVEANGQGYTMALIESQVKLNFRFNDNYRYDVVDNGRSAIQIPASNLKTTLVGSKSSKAQFSWLLPQPDAQQFEYYDLQLLKLEPYMFHSASANIQAQLDWTKAASYEVRDQNFNNPANDTVKYEMTLAKGTGFYVWRVRPIGNYYEGGKGDFRNYGQWSAITANNSLYTASGEHDVIESYNSSQHLNEALQVMGDVFYYTQFDEQHNWIYNKVLTEGAKQAETMTFANGLSQVEQTQTHLFSQKSVLATQNAYDYSGRPAISSLPAPIGSDELGFDAHLLVPQGQSTSLVASDFDTLEVDFVPVLDATGVDKVNSYYSDANNDNLSYKGSLIPDAGGYPYVRNLFYADPTGRTKKSAGPGSVMRLKSGAEGKNTTTLFGATQQNELDRLFGNEAPLAATVVKTITIDPNGVMSIAYMNKKGEVLATCLSNAKQPDNLEPVEDSPDTTSPFFAKTDYSTPLFYEEDLVMYTQTVINVEDVLTPYKLEYALYPQNFTFEDSCIAPEICETCDYEVTISIHGESDPLTMGDNLRFKQVFEGGACVEPIEREFDFNNTTEQQVSSVNMINYTSGTPGATEITFPVTGRYVISKKVRVINSELDSAQQLITDHIAALQLSFDSVYVDATDYNSIDHPFKDLLDCIGYEHPDFEDWNCNDLPICDENGGFSDDEMYDFYLDIIESNINKEAGFPYNNQPNESYMSGNGTGLISAFVKDGVENTELSTKIDQLLDQLIGKDDPLYPGSTITCERIYQCFGESEMLLRGNTGLFFADNDLDQVPVPLGHSGGSNARYYDSEFDYLQEAYACLGFEHGLSGKYYVLKEGVDQSELSGDELLNQDYFELFTQRVDPVIDFKWYNESYEFAVDYNDVHDNYRVVWNGYVQLPSDASSSVNFKINTNANQGVRFLIDADRDGVFENESGTLADWHNNEQVVAISGLTANQYYRVKLEYYTSTTENREVQLQWDATGNMQTIHFTNLFADASIVDSVAISKVQGATYTDYPLTEYIYVPSVSDTINNYLVRSCVDPFFHVDWDAFWQGSDEKVLVEEDINVLAVDSYEEAVLGVYQCKKAIVEGDNIVPFDTSVAIDFSFIQLNLLQMKARCEAHCESSGSDFNEAIATYITAQNAKVGVTSNPQYLTNDQGQLIDLSGSVINPGVQQPVNLWNYEGIIDITGVASFPGVELGIDPNVIDDPNNCYVQSMMAQCKSKCALSTQIKYTTNEYIHSSNINPDWGGNYESYEELVNSEGYLNRMRAENQDYEEVMHYIPQFAPYVTAANDLYSGFPDSTEFKKQLIEHLYAQLNEGIRNPQNNRSSVSHTVYSQLFGTDVPVFSTEEHFIMELIKEFDFKVADVYTNVFYDDSLKHVIGLNFQIVDCNEGPGSNKGEFFELDLRGNGCKVELPNPSFMSVEEQLLTIHYDERDYLHVLLADELGSCGANIFRGTFEPYLAEMTMRFRTVNNSWSAGDRMNFILVHKSDPSKTIPLSAISLAWKEAYTQSDTLIAHDVYHALKGYNQNIEVVRGYEAFEVGLLFYKQDFNPLDYELLIEPGSLLADALSGTGYSVLFPDVNYGDRSMGVSYSDGKTLFELLQTRFSDDACVVPFIHQGYPYGNCPLGYEEFHSEDIVYTKNPSFVYASECLQESPNTITSAETCEGTYDWVAREGVIEVSEGAGLGVNNDGFDVLYQHFQSLDSSAGYIFDFELYCESAVTCDFVVLLSDQDLYTQGGINSLFELVRKERLNGEFPLYDDVRQNLEQKDIHVEVLGYEEDGLTPFYDITFSAGTQRVGQANVKEKRNWSHIYVTIANWDNDTAIFDLRQALILRTSGNCEVCTAWEEPLTFIEPPLVEPEPFTCAEIQQSIVDNRMDLAIETYKEQAITALQEQHQQQCLYHIVDSLNTEYFLDYHHYTLYYYDRAGNLVKTVPPEGVIVHDDSVLATMDHREDPTMYPEVHWQHHYETYYDYNNLGQNIKTTTPDGGTTRFWYNDNSQLVLSQDAAQRAHKSLVNYNDEDHLWLTPKYSFMLYDYLGRIVEAGEMLVQPAYYAILNAGGVDPYANPTTMADMEAGLKTAFNNGSRPGSNPSRIYNYSEVTKTTYTEKQSISYKGQTQQHTRNRITKVARDVDDDWSTLNDQYVTYYSYDPHGNVEWLICEIPNLGRKSLRYEYDLVSGNVNKLYYQENQADQFIYRYEYDADNRILAVFTSTDDYLWTKEASYQFYDHGPLARTEVGHDNIQGCDYVYTIEGYLKSINQADLVPEHDPGADSWSDGQHFLNDEFAMELGYYTGDYGRSGTNIGADNAASPYSLSSSLYNGNISYWMSNTRAGQDPAKVGNAFGLSTRVFRYDQLNRLRKSDFIVWDNGNWNNVSDYDETFAYDRNGNLKEVTRHGFGTQGIIDRLSYSYDYQDTFGKPNNRLSKVVDSIGAHEAMGDLGELPEEIAGSLKAARNAQKDANYVYDAEGNLIKDVTEKLTIDWNVLNKVATVHKFEYADANDSLINELETITFEYDASGNRVAKNVHHAATGSTKRTFYVRDASGNTLATYEQQSNGGQLVTTLVEQGIYGSDRLGLYTPNLIVDVKDVSQTETVYPLPSTDFAMSSTLISSGEQLHELIETENGNYVSPAVYEVGDGNEISTVANMVDSRDNTILSAIAVTDANGTYLQLLNGRFETIDLGDPHRPELATLKSSDNAAIYIVPVPGSLDRYMVLYPQGNGTNYGTWNYIQVDLRAGEGDGAVVDEVHKLVANENAVNMHLGNNLTYVTFDNGTRFYGHLQDGDTLQIYKFELTRDGFTYPQLVTTYDYSSQSPTTNELPGAQSSITLSNDAEELFLAALCQNTDQMIVGDAPNLYRWDVDVVTGKLISNPREHRMDGVPLSVVVDRGNTTFWVVSKDPQSDAMSIKGWSFFHPYGIDDLTAYDNPDNFRQGLLRQTSIEILVGNLQASTIDQIGSGLGGNFYDSDVIDFNDHAITSTISSGFSPQWLKVNKRMLSAHDKEIVQTGLNNWIVATNGVDDEQKPFELNFDGAVGKVNEAGEFPYYVNLHTNIAVAEDRSGEAVYKFMVTGIEKDTQLTVAQNTGMGELAFIDDARNYHFYTRIGNLQYQHAEDRLITYSGHGALSRVLTANIDDYNGSGSEIIDLVYNTDGSFQMKVNAPDNELDEFNHRSSFSGFDADGAANSADVVKVFFGNPYVSNALEDMFIFTSERFGDEYLQRFYYVENNDNGTFDYANKTTLITWDTRNQSFIQHLNEDFQPLFIQNFRSGYLCVAYYEGENKGRIFFDQVSTHPVGGGLNFESLDDLFGANKQLLVDMEAQGSDPQCEFMLQDMNEDGLEDIVLYRGNGNINVRYRVPNQVGLQFSEVVSYSIASDLNGVDFINDRHVIAGDFLQFQEGTAVNSVDIAKVEGTILEVENETNGVIVKYFDNTNLTHNNAGWDADKAYYQNLVPTINSRDLSNDGWMPGAQPPLLEGRGASNYSVQYLAKLNTNVAGAHFFKLLYSGAVILKIDGQEIVNTASGIEIEQMALLEPGLHDLELILNKTGNDTYVELQWKEPGTGEFVLIPNERLVTTTNDWQDKYENYPLLTNASGSAILDGQYRIDADKESESAFIELRDGKYALVYGKGNYLYYSMLDHEEQDLFEEINEQLGFSLGTSHSEGKYRLAVYNDLVNGVNKCFALKINSGNQASFVSVVFDENGLVPVDETQDGAVLKVFQDVSEVAGIAINKTGDKMALCLRLTNDSETDYAFYEYDLVDGAVIVSSEQEVKLDPILDNGDVNYVTSIDYGGGVDYGKLHFLHYNKTEENRIMRTLDFTNQSILSISSSSDLSSVIKTGADGRLYFSRDGDLFSFERYGNPSFELYDQDRIGTFALPVQPWKRYYPVQEDPGITFVSSERVVGKRIYELKDHLGNVRVTLKDLRLTSWNSGIVSPSEVAGYVLGVDDYYAFGWGMPGRSYSKKDDYRYGFNGKERDPEWKAGAIYDYGFRIYDPRISKFLSVDPLAPDYPWYTPYQFAGNKPIMAIDLDGLEELIVIEAPAVMKAIDGYIKKGDHSSVKGAYNYASTHEWQDDKGNPSTWYQNENSTHRIPTSYSAWFDYQRQTLPESRTGSEYMSLLQEYGDIKKGGGWVEFMYHDLDMNGGKGGYRSIGVTPKALFMLDPMKRISGRELDRVDPYDGEIDYTERTPKTTWKEDMKTISDNHTDIPYPITIYNHSVTYYNSKYKKEVFKRLKSLGPNSIFQTPITEKSVDGGLPIRVGTATFIYTLDKKGNDKFQYIEEPYDPYRTENNGGKSNKT